MSTRAVLQTLEDLEIIDSARDILDAIERGGRKVAPYMADPAALSVRSGRTKSTWLSTMVLDIDKT